MARDENAILTSTLFGRPRWNGFARLQVGHWISVLIGDHCIDLNQVGCDTDDFIGVRLLIFVARARSLRAENAESIR